MPQPLGHLERIKPIKRERAAREPLKGFDAHPVLAGRFDTDCTGEAVFRQIAGERWDIWHGGSVSGRHPCRLRNLSKGAEQKKWGVLSRRIVRLSPRRARASVYGTEGCWFEPSGV